MTPKQNNEIREILTNAHFDHEKGLNARAFFKISNHELGEDLVQTTFLKTWRYLLKGGKIETIKSFLYHILNNLIVDEYRKHKTVSLDNLVEKGFEPSDKDTDRMLDILDGKDAFKLIALLPFEYRKIMSMRYIQELSPKEMSIATGTTKNSVAVKLHRGLRKLRLLYNPA